MTTTTLITPSAPGIGGALPSPAGPLDGTPAPKLPAGPALPPLAQTARFMSRPLPFLFQAQRELGETFAFLPVANHGEPLIVCSHPDHARSLFTAPPDLVPSITSESPLRPVLGARSVLTANGPEHLRRRKLLLPPFHGEAIARYEQVIEELVHREIDGWRPGDSFPMSKRMQAVTLDVIMAGIFGVQGELEPGSIERALRDTTRRLLHFSEGRTWQMLELANMGRPEPRAIMRTLLQSSDRHYYRIIRARRDVPAAQRGTDILSLLLAVTDEDGRPLGDEEIRDQLVTLVLAGHETTANSLAWTFERLVRTPAAYDSLRDAVRAGGTEGDEYVAATIHESMRARPVIPIIGRRPKSAWQLGEHVVPAGMTIAIAIALLHHREDLYPQPFAFAPERFLGVTPGTYTWIPFGGGTRRCLGATLAMAEQRIVVRAICERVDLEYVDPAPEREQHRNVTIIPRAGGLVRVAARVQGSWG
jgi:cytochrome P450